MVLCGGDVVCVWTGEREGAWDHWGQERERAAAESEGGGGGGERERERERSTVSLNACLH